MVGSDGLSGLLRERYVDPPASDPPAPDPPAPVQQMFNNVVLGSSNEPFEAVIKKVKKEKVRWGWLTGWVAHPHGRGR